MAKIVKMFRQMPTACLLNLEKEHGISIDDNEAIEAWIKERISATCEIVLHDALSYILPKIAVEPPKEIGDGEDIYFSYEHKGVKFAIVAHRACVDLRVSAWTSFNVGD